MKYVLMLIMLAACGCAKKQMVEAPAAAPEAMPEVMSIETEGYESDPEAQAEASGDEF